MSSPTEIRRSPVIIARIALLVASVGAVVVILVRSDETFDTLRTIDVAPLVWIVILQALYLLPQAYRYWLVLHGASTQRVPFWAWTRVFVVGRFLNLAFTQAGNVYRAIVLKRRFGVTYAEYVTSFVAFTWLATLLNLVLAITVVLITDPGYSIGGVPIVLAMLSALLVGIATPLLLAQILHPSDRPATRLGRLHTYAAVLLETSVSLLRRLDMLARFVAVGLVGFATAVAIFDLTFRSLAIDVPLETTVLFYVLLQLTTYVAITPGNLGIQELGFGGLAEATGIGVATGLLAGAVIRITGVVALAIVGMGLGGARAASEARRMAQEPPDSARRSAT